MVFCNAAFVVTIQGSSPTLTVGPTSTRVTKAVATLKGLRSYTTREMARDMHEERAGGVHHEENLRSRSIRKGLDKRYARPVQALSSITLRKAIGCRAKREWRGG
jgi:hypothetical protein